MLRTALKTLALFVLAAIFLGSPAAAQTKLLRFLPIFMAIKVAFTYGGDLWIASTSGGLATRLTAHPGLELFAKFSPDGKWIAFTGQYDGDEQVYVIPVTGGVPKQLTFYPSRGRCRLAGGYDNQVYGWTPDGKSVVFRSLRDFFELGDNRLYTVSVDGGLPQALPCRNPARVISRPMAPRRYIRRCFAISAPGSATRRLGPSSSTSLI